MDSPTELFRLSVEVRCTGSLDRLGLSPSIRPPEADCQQQSFSNPSAVASSESGLARAGVVRKTYSPGLAGDLQPSPRIAGDLCGPSALPGNRLSGSKL